jgi:transaldolase
MELYLDSANLKEIEEGFKLGFLNGLTTTPTFMQKEGITDVDGTILKLSEMVPVLQIEALGHTAEEVLAEAERQLALGLDPTRTVFKIPVSLEGVRACRILRDKGYLVNVHLVYTCSRLTWPCMPERAMCARSWAGSRTRVTMHSPSLNSA